MCGAVWRVGGWVAVCVKVCVCVWQCVCGYVRVCVGPGVAT